MLLTRTVLALIAVALFSACKPRQATSGLAQAPAAEVRLSREVIGKFDKSGGQAAAALATSSKAFVSVIKSGPERAVDDRRDLIASTMALNADLLRTQQYGLNLKLYVAHYLEDDKSKIHIEKHNLIYSKRKTVEALKQAGQSLADDAVKLIAAVNGAQLGKLGTNGFKTELETGITDLIAKIGNIQSDIRTLIATATLEPSALPQQTEEIEDAVLEQDVVDVAPANAEQETAGNEAESATTDDTAEAPAGESTADTPPAEPRPLPDLQERQGRFISMVDIFKRLSDPKQAAELNLPKRDEIQSIVNEMRKLKAPSINPHDCGPPPLPDPRTAVQFVPRPKDACFGHLLLERLTKVDELKSLFDGIPVVNEGYDLRTHSLMALEVYWSQQGFYDLASMKIPDVHLETLMPVVLAFHDIGKPVAVVHGNSSLQHTFSIPIITAVLPAMGFTAAETRLAENLVNHDALGQMIMGIDYYDGKPQDERHKAATQMFRHAMKAGLPSYNFYALQKLYYTSDAASYPSVQFKAFEKGRSRIVERPRADQLYSRNGSLEILGTVFEFDRPTSNRPAGSARPVLTQPTITQQTTVGEAALPAQLRRAPNQASGSRPTRDMGGLTPDVGDEEIPPFSFRR